MAGSKSKINQKDLEKILEERKVLIENAIIGRLKLAGEKFVANARSTNTYKDQTGNLRSSIGFRVLKHGVSVTEGIQKGSVGSNQAKKVLDAAKERNPTGLVLNVCAGMGYAAAVESRSLDVLTGSSLIAEEDLKKSLEELKNKLNKK